MLKKKKIIYSILILLFLTGFIAYLSLGTNALPPYNNPKAACISDMHMIGLSMRMYSNVYDEHFPAGKKTSMESLALLIETGFLETLSCYTSHGLREELSEYYKKHKKIPEELSCYRYNPGLSERAPVDSIVMYYYKPSNWATWYSPNNEEGRMILFVDGHCKFHPEEDFQKMQKKTLDWIKKNKEEKYNKTNPQDAVPPPEI